MINLSIRSKQTINSKEKLQKQPSQLKTQTKPQKITSTPYII